MFQNGMSEEVPNYFVQEEVAKHAHETGVRGTTFDNEQGMQGMFRNQFVDPRTQLMGQQFQQYAAAAYPGAAFPTKVVNGDYIDPRMQLQQQLQLQQQQQQYRSQMTQAYFDPVQLQQQQQQQQQGGFGGQAYDFQRHQHALQLARQQEMFGNQGMQIRPSQQQQQQIIRPPQMDFVNRHFNMGHQQQQQQVAKPLLELPALPSLPSENESIENLHDLFGGVEKLFGDDPSQDSKPAIPGMGSLGASLINGCEAELFGDSGGSMSGDGGQFFTRGMFRRDHAGKVPEPSLVDNRQVSDHHSFPAAKVPTPYGGGVQMQQPTPGGHFVADALQQFGQNNLQQQQQQQQQRMDVSAADRWQNQNKGNNVENFPLQQNNNPMARNTLQLFRDMDETEAGGGYMNKQIPGFDQGLKAQPGIHRESSEDPARTTSLDNNKQRLNSESPQIHFQPQHPSPESGHWVKQPISKPPFHSSPGGERVSSPSYRIQPDRLLLDAGKQQHQSDDVQRLLSMPNALGQQASEDTTTRLANHQGDSAMKSRAYFEALEQQKHVQNAPRVHNNANGPSNSGYPHFQGYSDTQRKIPDNQPTGPSFPWNIAVAPRQNATPDAWLRNNSLDPYKSAGKPGFGASSMAHTDTPSTSEVVKPAAKDTFMENGPSCSTGLSDHRLSKNSLQIADKSDAEPEPTEIKPPPAFRTQSYPPRFSSPMGSFQDVNKRHIVGPKEKEAMISTSIFQSTAAAANQAAALKSPPATTSVRSPQQHYQHMQPNQAQPQMQPSQAQTQHIQAQTQHIQAQTQHMQASQAQQVQHIQAQTQHMQAQQVQHIQAQTQHMQPSQGLPQHMQQQQQQQQPQQERTQERIQSPSVPPQERSQLQHAIPSGMGDPPSSNSIYSRPAESDSINDIVQQQRVIPSVSHAPEVPPSTKTEPRQAEHRHPSTPSETGPPSRHSEGDDERKKANENLNEKQVNHFRAQPSMVLQQQGGFNSMAQVSQQQQAGINALMQNQHALNSQVPTQPEPVVQVQVPQQNTQIQTQIPQQHQSSTVQVPQAKMVAGMEQQQPEQQQASLAQQQQVGMNAAALFMAQANLAVGQQSLQTSNPALDLQRIMQSPMPITQQNVQAALQAFKNGPGGSVSGVPPENNSVAATSTATTGTNSNEPPQATKQHVLLNSTFAKKRKLEVPPLLPWRMTISQQSGALPTIRPPELQWAAETNRLPEREGDEDYYAHDESLRFITRARQRLKLTTQLVQHILPPVSSGLMHSNTVEDRESATYILAQLSLGEACRMTQNEDQQAKTNATPEEKVDGYNDRIKYLENTLQRLESLPLTLEFVKNTQYLDKVCVTNRLMKCHQELFPVNFSSQRRIQPVHRSYPQPYVSASPMPATIPGGYQLIPL